MSIWQMLAIIYVVIGFLLMTEALSDPLRGIFDYAVWIVACFCWPLIALGALAYRVFEYLETSRRRRQ